MNQDKSCNLGVMFRREYVPETLPDFARSAEASGFDELWVVEDCFWASGVASAATALACTESITVGLGIMPAVVRNPVFAAMEIATLARLFPGRFLPGFGHGVAEWMYQIGAFPKSQLAALEETTLTVRRLLAGEAVTFEGKHVQLDGAELLYPPAPVPPVSLGVMGPKSLALSGRVADGTILSEFTPPACVAWSREQIAVGQAEADHESDHRVTLFAFAKAAETTDEARRQLRPLVADAIASGDIDTKIAPLGILPEVKRLLADGGRENLEAKMPDEWIDQVTIAGTRENWQEAVGRFVDAGVFSVIATPTPDSSPDELEDFARNLLPR